MPNYSSNIRIDGSSLFDELEITTYETEVYRLIEKRVNATLTGKALLRAVARIHGKNVTVKPKIKVLRCDSPDQANAYVEADSVENATKKGKSVYGRRKYGLTGVTRENLEGWPEPGKGTGRGSDTTIYFTPDQWANPHPVYEQAHAAFHADDLFVHEMTHALRDIAGVSFLKRVRFQKRLDPYSSEKAEKVECKSGEVKVVKYRERWYIKKDCYPNIEEWFAVLIQNIYRSECKRPLRVAYTSSFGNYTEKQFIRLGLNRAHMRQFRREHRELFSELREIDVPFNPTRLVLDL